MNRLSLLFVCLFWLNGGTKLQAQKSSSRLTIRLVHTYHFEKGYTNNYLTVSGDTVALSCPNLGRVYFVNTATKAKQHFDYGTGRGPGEIIRGPFGMDFDRKNHLLYLADPDVQRFSVLDYSNGTFRTKLFKANHAMLLIANYNGPLILVSPNTSGILASFLYNPKKKKIVREFKYPNATKDPFRYSGIEAVTQNYIIHADVYYGDLFVWHKHNGKFIKRSIIVNTRNLRTKSAKFGKFTGSIPPQNPPLQISFIIDNPMFRHRVFLLMHSKNGKYKSNYVYDYDFMHDKIISKYKLPAKGELLASRNTNLFVYAKEKNALYHYKLAKK